MAGIRAMGTKLTLKKQGSETEDLVIANLTSIGEQSTEIEEIDVTTLDSPGGAKEFISGTKDPGSIDMAGNAKTEGQVDKLYSVFKAGDNREFEIEYPNGDTLALEGYLSKFTFGEVTTDGLYTFGLSLRLSGLPEFTEHA